MSIAYIPFVSFSFSVGIRESFPSMDCDFILWSCTVIFVLICAHCIKFINYNLHLKSLYPNDVLFSHHPSLCSVKRDAPYQCFNHSFLVLINISHQKFLEISTKAMRCQTCKNMVSGGINFFPAIKRNLTTVQTRMISLNCRNKRTRMLDHPRRSKR